MPPRVGNRSRVRGVHTVRLADIDQPHRDPTITPPPLEGLLDHVLPESGDGHRDSTSHGVESEVYLATPPPPPAPAIAPPIVPASPPLVPPVALAIPFKINTNLGSSNADIANKWLKKVIKVFELMKLINTDKVDNVHGLLQGNADGWFDGIRRRHGVILTWDQFVYEFRQEYLSESFRKGKYDAFFRLFQGSLSLREYIDKFEDVYCFVSDMLLYEEAKCDRFRQGLHVNIRSSMTWSRGNNFRELQEEKEYEQKMSRKHIGSGRGCFVNTEQQVTRPQFSQSSVAQPGQGQGYNFEFEQKKRHFPQCATCSRYHVGECRKFDKCCFECGSSGHFKKDCTLLISKDNGSQQGSVAP
ncbi:hypothetical protein MANES_06G025101v8 [Manihot esculenta]|uniref:Uncharacterized protein n=1 Tax=Manihot esculenta TaxID=3983 RepID=A0ACB7HH60_MANES|nr:hypothetical protein MANES_06G025101v8 [Manihot esculenta]